MPTRRRCVKDFPDLTYPYWTPEADIAHEVFINYCSMTMKVKTTIIKQNPFLYSISERKDLCSNGFLWGSYHSFISGTSLSSNITQMRIITDLKDHHPWNTLILKTLMILILTMLV